MRRQICKCPVESADRGAGRAHDDNVVFHQKLLLGQTLGHSAVFWHCRILGRPSLSVNSTHRSVIADNWRFFDLSARDADGVPALPRCHKTVAQRSGNWLCLKPGQGKRVSDMSEDKKEPVTIKKYANRRLYNTGTSTYVTLEDLATMVKNGEDFVVYDAKTGEDITRSVLAQIIFEQENKEGQSLLPITFLRQLIRFYGDSMQMLVPRFLEASIESLSKEQGKFREQMAQAFGVGAFGPLEDQVRRNMEMFEKTFAMFAPFARGQAKPTDKTQGSGTGSGSEMDDLKRQLDEMQKRLDKLGGKD
jgi:polyhydroxyalkanoate synthesis repressor PhaR